MRLILVLVVLFFMIFFMTQLSLAQENVGPVHVFGNLVDESWLNSELMRFLQDRGYTQDQVEQIAPIYIAAYPKKSKNYKMFQTEYSELCNLAAKNEGVAIYYIENDGIVAASFSQKISRERLKSILENLPEMELSGRNMDEMLLYVSKSISLSFLEPEMDSEDVISSSIPEEQFIKVEGAEIKPKEIKPGEKITVTVRLNEKILSKLNSGEAEKANYYRSLLESKIEPIEVRALFYDKNNNQVKSMKLNDMGLSTDEVVGDLVFSYSGEIMLDPGNYEVKSEVNLNEEAFQTAETESRSFSIAFLTVGATRPEMEKVYFEKEYLDFGRLESKRGNAKILLLTLKGKGPTSGEEIKYVKYDLKINERELEKRPTILYEDPEILNCIEGVCSYTIPIDLLVESEKGVFTGKMKPYNGYEWGDWSPEAQYSFGIDSPEVIYIRTTPYYLLAGENVEVEALVKSSVDFEAYIDVPGTSLSSKLERVEGEQDIYRAEIDTSGLAPSTYDVHVVLVNYESLKLQKAFEVLKEDDKPPQVMESEITPKFVDLKPLEGEAEREVTIKANIIDIAGKIPKWGVNVVFRPQGYSEIRRNMNPVDVDERGSGIYSDTKVISETSLWRGKMVGVYLDIEDFSGNKDEVFIGGFYVLGEEDPVKPLAVYQDVNGDANADYENKIDLVFVPLKYAREERPYYCKIPGIDCPHTKFENAVMKKMDWFLEKIGDENPREHFNYWYLDSFDSHICSNDNYCDLRLIHDVISSSEVQSDQVIVFVDDTISGLLHPLFLEIAGGLFLATNIIVGITSFGTLLAIDYTLVNVLLGISMGDVTNWLLLSTDHTMPLYENIIVIPEPHAFSRQMFAHGMGHALFNLSDTGKTDIGLYYTSDTYPTAFMSKTGCEAYVEEMFEKGELEVEATECERIPKTGWYRIKWNKDRIMAKWNNQFGPIGFDPLAMLKINYVLENIASVFG